MMIGVWISAAALLAASAIHMAGWISGVRLMHGITKPMLVPIIIALYCCVCAVRGKAVSWMVITALALGCVGDIMLMASIIKKQFFAVGMLFFWIGHVFYMLCVFGIPFNSSPSVWRYAVLFAVICVMVFLLIVLVKRLFPHVEKPMRPACFVYMTTLAVVVALMIYAHMRMPTYATMLLAAGSILFAASDTVLATHTFALPRAKADSIVIMSTYIAAQVCIALGFALV